MTRASGLDTELHAQALSCGDPGRVGPAFDALVLRLAELCDGLAPDEWDGVILALRNSALFPILMEDPLARRCFFRRAGWPREGAFPQDPCMAAEMAAELAAASATGRALHGLFLARPFWQGLENRRRRGTGFLAEIAAETQGPRILALAAGHLHGLGADLAGRIAPGLVALDDDGAALACLARGLPGAACHRAALPDLFEAPVAGPYDACLCPSLVTTLPDATAVRYMGRLLGLLRPGGRLLLSSFLREALDRGYLEAVLDWKYLYRDEADLARLVSRLEAPCATRVYREPSGQVVFLELTKTGNSKTKE